MNKKPAEDLWQAILAAQGKLEEAKVRNTKEKPE